MGVVFFGRGGCLGGSRARSSRASEFPHVRLRSRRWARVQPHCGGVAGGILASWGPGQILVAGGPEGKWGRVGDVRTSGVRAGPGSHLSGLQVTCATYQESIMNQTKQVKPKMVACPDEFSIGPLRFVFVSGLCGAAEANRLSGVSGV